MRIYLSIGMVLFAVTQSPVSGFWGGNGTWEDPYRIRTAANLIALGEDPNLYDKAFILIADIDLDPNLPGGQVFDRAVVAPDQNEVEEGFQGPGFSGRFDGDGHCIRNLTIQGGSYLGLFGRLTDEARISNLGVKGVSVQATGGDAGGLVAWNESGTIDTCLSIGTVVGQGSGIGGLVASNKGRVTRCYTTGTVQGNSYVGGLVGTNIGGFIAASYSAALVDGSGFVGGLVAYNNRNGRVTRSFWDMDASGLAFSGGGVGLSTADMMDPEMVGLNGLALDSHWVLDAQRDYPRLAWEGSPGSMVPWPRVDWLEGSGSPRDPFRIAQVDQLKALSKAGALMDRAFMQTADLDLGGEMWPQPVLPDFSGRFDGNGLSIRRLRIQGYDGLGFFGHVDTHAFVTGVVLEAVDVNGVGHGIGGLVGVNWGTLSDCHITGTVRGDSAIAGLVGWNEGRIESCSSDTSTSGRFDTGGLVGHNRGSLASNHCSGQVQGSSNTGGLVGWDTAIDHAISDCVSTCTVSGRDRVGGLVGYNWGGIHGSGALIRCSNSGTVTGRDDLGGLVGSNGGPVAACSNTGVVSGEDTVGGLIGNNHGIITECSSRAPVTGEREVGGLVGSNTESITFCFSDGSVQGESDVGGLVGSSQGPIANCFSKGDVSSTGDVMGSHIGVGGLVGFNRGEIEHCYSAGRGAGDETNLDIDRQPGNETLGGLVGWEIEEIAFVTASFWDIEISGLDRSAGGTGLTTAEMQTSSTYLDTGWDFIGEDENGTEDIWWIDEGKDYPQLWWDLPEDIQ